MTADGAEARTKRPMWRRPWVVVPAVLLAVLAGVAWWTYPGNRIDRQFARVELPDGFRLDREVSDIVPWFPECFDQCSRTTRHYTAPVPEQAAVSAAAAALREAGYEITLEGPCGPKDQPADKRECVAFVHGQTDRFSASARVRSAVDGRARLELSISVSG